MSAEIQPKKFFSAEFRLTYLWLIFSAQFSASRIFFKKIRLAENWAAFLPSQPNFWKKFGSGVYSAWKMPSSWHWTGHSGGGSKQSYALKWTIDAKRTMIWWWIGMKKCCCYQCVICCLQNKRLGALNKFKARDRSILIATDVASRYIYICCISCLIYGLVIYYLPIILHVLALSAALLSFLQRVSQHSLLC